MSKETSIFSRCFAKKRAGNLTLTKKTLFQKIIEVKFLIEKLIALQRKIAGYLMNEKGFYDFIKFASTSEKGYK